MGREEDLEDFRLDITDWKRVIRVSFSQKARVTLVLVEVTLSIRLLLLVQLLLLVLLFCILFEC